MSAGKQSTASAGTSGSKLPVRPKDAGIKTDGGPKADGGATKKPDASAGDAAAAKDSGRPSAAAPVVQILEPVAATDPNSDPIVTTSMVTVRCKVTKSLEPGARDVNQSTARILLVNTTDPKMSTVGIINALPDNTFEAQFNLTALPNGPLRFSCDASDVGMPALMGSGAVDTFLDLGPSIGITEPKNNGNYARRTPVPIEFQVLPAPVSADDTQATPVDVHLDVSGHVFAITEDPKQPGLFRASPSVDFDDTTLFPMAPVFAEITITAASSRKTNTPTRTTKVDINIDADGPAIAVTSPANGVIVRGEVTLVVTIKDPSGVDVTTIVADIEKGLHTLAPADWKVSGTDTYTAMFDSLAFDPTLTTLNIVITASDKVGNPPINKTALMLRLDNVPPLLSLDPPLIREWKPVGPDTVCSDPFDPVGGDAKSDGQTVPDSGLYRLLLWDEANHSLGENFSYISGVKASTVQLYVQHPNISFLIDTNGDGRCDEINFNALPQAMRPTPVALSPLVPRGSAFFNPSANFTSASGHVPDPLLFTCKPGPDANPPAALCPVAYLMPRVIPGPSTERPPAVYAYGQPTNSSSGPCEGETWPLRPLMGEGWVCLAARAEDNLGNVGISPPLRICIDDGMAGNGTPDCSVGAKPTCVDNCTPPPNFPNNMTLDLQ